MILLWFEIGIMIEYGILGKHLGGVLREHTSKFVDVDCIYFGVALEVINRLNGQNTKISCGLCKNFLYRTLTFLNDWFSGSILYRGCGLCCRNFYRFNFRSYIFKCFFCFILSHKIVGVKKRSGVSMPPLLRSMILLRSEISRLHQCHRQTCRRRKQLH